MIGQSLPDKSVNDKPFLFDSGCQIFSDSLQYKSCLQDAHGMDLLSQGGAALIKHAVRDSG
eukprot:583429-Karenia_brevis.AAC.1